MPVWTAVDGAPRGATRIRRAVASVIGLCLLVWCQMTAEAAVITVDTLADNTAVDGRCSLREAVQAANSDLAVDSCAAGSGLDTIEFAVQGILPLAAQLVTTSEIVLSGPGARLLAIDGGGATRLFRGTSGSLTIRGMTLQNASADRGSAIRMDGSGDLTVQDVRITAGAATVFGSGIYFNSGGDFILERSLLDAHVVGTQVVMINAEADAVLIRNTTFSGNSPSDPGQATVIHLSNAATTGLTAVLDHVTISDGRIRNTSGSDLQYGNSVFAGATVGGVHIDCSDPSRCINALGNYSNAAADNVGPAPLITPLGNYGGPTDSHALCTAAGVPHASCAASSDAVNGASAAATSEDQRGFSRDNNTTADAGAVEGGGVPSVDIPAGGGTVRYDPSTGIVRILSADGTELQAVPLSVLSNIELVGTDGADEVSLAAEIAALNLTIDIDLGDGFDTLTMEGGTSSGEVTYRFDNATDGAISIAGGATINYIGLDPIVDHLLTADRTFTFSGSAETIILSGDGDGAASNGYSFIDSDLAEEVSFRNPTTSLTINTGGGANTVVLGKLDTPLAGTFNTVTVNGGANPDAFTVAPAAYPISISGGDPSATCPGDGLVLSGSAVVSAFTNTAGTGSFSFSSGEADVSFAGIESVGEASLSIAANYTTLYATDELVASNALEITVTNEGPDAAGCAAVTFSEALSAWLASAAASDESGPVAGTTWRVDGLASGESTTLTITGFVVPAAPHTTSFTLDALQDTDTTDNTVSIQLSHGFLMPAKAHVKAALYYERSAGGGTHDALVVGLYQGSPGREGSVWCKVPDSAPGWPPAGVPSASIGNQFRPCSEGLPFPLHVNDLFEDALGTLWVATWGSKGLYKSEDEGRTWEASGPFAATGTVHAIVQAPAGGPLYASAGGGTVLRSFDGGARWQELGGLPGMSADVPWALAVHPLATGTLYAGTPGNGVYVSEDFGFTWDVLEEAGTENDVLISNQAGHVFDLEFSTDANYLYAGTASGVWRADLTAGPANFTGTWELLGPTVTLDDASTVTPEVRNLTFVDDGADDDLVAGTWGFGAYAWDDPNNSAVHEELALRGSQVTFVAAAPNGQVYLGSTKGVTTMVAVSSASSTASDAPAEETLPEGYALSQNYPNPFNPVTTIGFDVPGTAQVRLAVFDNLGREVAVLVDGIVEAGRHTARFDALGLPSGTYLYRLQTGYGDIARTLVLMK